MGQRDPRNRSDLRRSHRRLDERLRSEESRLGVSFLDLDGRSRPAQRRRKMIHELLEGVAVTAERKHLAESIANLAITADAMAALQAQGKAINIDLLLSIERQRSAMLRQLRQGRRPQDRDRVEAEPEAVDLRAYLNDKAETRRYLLSQYGQQFMEAGDERLSYSDWIRLVDARYCQSTYDPTKPEDVRGWNDCESFVAALEDRPAVLMPAALVKLAEVDASRLLSSPPIKRRRIRPSAGA